LCCCNLGFVRQAERIAPAVDLRVESIPTVRCVV
jgi:hypothetical protein